MKDIKLVYQVINDLSYIPRNIEEEELVQIGRIALWKASESYKPNERYSLITHSYKVVRREIIDYLRKMEAKKRRPIVLNEVVEQRYECNVINGLIVEQIQGLLSKSEYDFIYDKFALGFTDKRLCEKYNLTAKQVRTRKNKLKVIIKDTIKLEETDL